SNAIALAQYSRRSPALPSSGNTSSSARPSASAGPCQTDQYGSWGSTGFQSVNSKKGTRCLSTLTGRTGCPRQSAPSSQLPFLHPLHELNARLRGEQLRARNGDADRTRIRGECIGSRIPVATAAQHEIVF